MKTKENQLINQLDELTVSQLKRVKEAVDLKLAAKKASLSELSIKQSQRLHPVCKS
jgi:hypothetical protein